jgi:hypothetical protein
MSWLISYQSRYGMLRETGIRFNEPMDTVELIEDHPGRYFGQMRADLLALEDAVYAPEQGPQTAYDVVRIYSAIEAPKALLSPAHIRAFEN